ncbi:MAG TPA: hypothetical protein VHM92_05220 [Allosphingosinicella sp.]|nr:hypothetical protein [Allosphingosinicella sp.]
MRIDPSMFFSGCGPARVALVLIDADQGEWTLTVSSGMERFIGFYPRLDGIASDGPLLRYRVADPA